MIKCRICNQEIVKYKLDSEDTVCLDVKNNWKYLCEQCSYIISLCRKYQDETKGNNK